MSKADKDAAVAQLLGRIKAGGTVFPEDADRLAAALDLQDEVKEAAANPDKVFEWVDASARHGKVRLQVPEHQAVAEEAAREVLDGEITETVATQPVATGSNDPAVNVAATGQKPFENTDGVGFSGQVIDAGEYKPE